MEAHPKVQQNSPCQDQTSSINNDILNVQENIEDMEDAQTINLSSVRPISDAKDNARDETAEISVDQGIYRDTF